MRAFTAAVFLLLGVGAVVVRTAEGSEPWLRSEKLAELGTEVTLPCVLKSSQCDGLHSIKWYHGSTRIFIFSEDAGIIRGSGNIANRADIEYLKNSSKTYLKIPEVQLEDEGLYKCEATYLAVNRECNNVQHVIINVTVQPPFIRVIDENSKNTLSTGATLGPINEGSKISLYCESGEGKPVPTVEWFKGDQLLEATSSATVTNTGIGAGSSLLEMQITREELGATFTCKVNSIALMEPLTVDIKPDVQVRPLKIVLDGVVGHVVQGTKILLQCTVYSARPPANVTWQNGTQLVASSESNERFEMFDPKVHENDDGTSDTISYFSFTASVYDNDKTFKCFAENSVTRAEDLKPMTDTKTIEVLYPPIIKMKPSNLTVNETDDFVIFCDYEANPASLIKVTWLRDEVELLVLQDERYEGGITEHTALTVKNATPNDMGSYKCILENGAGSSVSEDAVEVSVFYKPVVEVIMDPETPVNEADRVNVSLTCEVEAGNPAALSAVRWYLDGDLLKELPDCPRNSTGMTTPTEESLTFCDIDPSKLLLESVGRSFHGNYSCEGRNEAGWGPVSPVTPVIVYYKPGPASIFYEPSQVVKKRSLKITCVVMDPGRPKVSGFKWLRGWHRLPDENNATLVIDSVNLETEANFTCLAYNEAGDGEPATTFIDVSATPSFIKKLQYYGYVYNAPNVSIMCWVECAPICNISWHRDDVPMDFSKTNRYYVSDVYHPPDPRTNDFESIQSTLVWNLTAWPNGQLDRAEDNVKFTCKSSSNEIGPGVESSTHFHVEFPPEDITISKRMINVTVDTIAEVVECDAKARPKPSFRWVREGSNDTIVEGQVFDFKIPVPRRSNGTYYCEASNRHGALNISMVMNVQFKPECHIEKERLEGRDYVVCSSVANPKETDFTWSLKNDNDTLERIPELRNGRSYVLLDTSVTNLRTYVCVANNTIGHSVPCERDIPANHGHKSNIPWWHQFGNNLLLIIIVAAVVIIVVLILICVAIYITCRRRHSEMKYITRVVKMEEREHPDGGPPSPTVSSHSMQGSAQPTPAPRWPLKPGVLVHINRTHSLRSGLSVRANEAALRNELAASKRNDDEPFRQKFLDETSLSSPNGRPNPGGRVFRRGRKDQAAHRTTSMSSLHEDGMLARANKIKAMFGVQLREQATLPGISREKTAVTYKRIVPRQRVLHSLESSRETNRGNASRKRKKPGADPNQANNNHVNSVSEALPDSGTKTFYENLPFHGIQAPPNKLVSPKFARVSALHGTLHHSVTASPCSSRPPSRALSLCDGSSGYESTMSHLGPHYNVYNVPRGNSPVLKYNTLKPRRRKQKHSQQFYSLRLCRRHESIRRKYELHAIPIYKCPHKTDSTTTIATIVRSMEDAPSLTLSQGSASVSLLSRSAPSTPPLPPPSSPPPPIPMPRTSRKTDPSKHTYQNVPPPVFPPKNASLPKLKTDSLFNYKEHYQQQQHRQEMQQYSYPLPSNSSNQLTLPLTRNLYQSSIVSPLQTSFVHTNNIRPSTLMHREATDTGNHLPAVHRDEEQEQPPSYGQINHDARQSRRHATNRRNERNRKYRNRAPSDRSKSKQSRGQRGDAAPQQRRDDGSVEDSPARETVFRQIPDLGVPERMYKISYPHYYEDEDIAECSTEFHRTNSTAARQQQQQWDRQSNRCVANNATHYASDASDAKNRGKTSKARPALGDIRKPSAPTIMQYAELHFRDVGQEIDV